MGQPLHAVPIPLNRNCVGQPRPEDLVCGAAEDVAPLAPDQTGMIVHGSVEAPHLGGNMLTPGENELPNLKTLVFNDTPWVNHSTLDSRAPKI
jgi:hypothetical protein